MKKNKKNKSKLGINSEILHSDYWGGTEHGSIHYGIQPSVTFGYKDVRDLIAVFQGRKKGYAYSRNSSPSLTALEKQVTLMERGRSSMVFATGMAAISSTFFSLLQTGDHIIASCYLFGNTYSFFKTLIRLGFTVDFVDVCKIDDVCLALRPDTKFFFAETIANPGTQIPDWKGISQVIAQHEKKSRKIVSIIDNTLTTPYLFCPKEWGFSFSVNSLTKHMAGQGSVLAGSITDLGNWFGVKDENIILEYKQSDPEGCQMLQIRKKGMRDMGSTLSPFSAHLVALGLETLSLRMEKHLNNAQVIAEFLNNHPKVSAVYYPGLKTHPQYRWSQQYYRGNGSLLSFILRDPSPGKKKISPLISFFNSLRLIIKSSHLGDARTLAIPVAQTIFHEMKTQEKKKVGIDENQIRLSVGIEDVEDILSDLDQALNKI